MTDDPMRQDVPHARKNRIRHQLHQLERLGVIEVGQSYVQSDMPGLRWTIVPCGFSARSLTTSGIEDFILGAMAAVNSKTKEAAAGFPWTEPIR